jgi:general secretion pathway protein N
MSSRITLLALGLGVYLAVAIASFPAALAYRWFGPERLTLASIDGTIWRGNAAFGAIGGFAFSDLRWRLHPAALLTGRISLSAETRLNDGFASANVAASGSRVELTQVRAATSLKSLRELASLGDISGQLSLSLERLDLVEGWPVAAEGMLEIAELVAPPLVPMSGVSQIPLGSYRAEITTTEEPGILALVNDLGGPLELTGRISLSPDRSYLFDTLIKPRSGAPDVLVEGLDLVSGEPNAQGQRKFVQRGSL